LLLRFLKVYDFDLEQALKLLKLNLEMRWKMPKLFENRDFMSDEFQRAFKTFQVFPLENHTAENHKVIVLRLVNPDPEVYSVLELCRLVTAMADVRVITVDASDLVPGDITIVDMKGFGFRHFLKNTANISATKAYMKYAQEAMPVRIVQSHYINCSPAVHKLYNLLKPFISKDFQKTIKIHSRLESLHEFIQPDILPIEYGGTAGYSENLNSNWKEVMISKKYKN
jgi:hypothetical protein